MAKKVARQIIVLKNPETGTLYYTRKNPTLMPYKMVQKKYAWSGIADDMRSFFVAAR